MRNPDPSALSSVPAFAKSAGVSPTAVRKWIAQGKLKGATREVGRRTFIDHVKANDLLPGRLTRFHQRKKRKRKPGPKPKRTPTFREKMQTIEGTEAETMTLTEARVINERFKARLVELQVREKEGALIPADETLRAIDDVFHVARDAIQNIPARVAPMIAALPARDIERRLAEEIQTILGDLSSAIATRFRGRKDEDREADRGILATGPAL